MGGQKARPRFDGARLGFILVDEFPFRFAHALFIEQRGLFGVLSYLKFDGIVMASLSVSLAFQALSP